MIKPTIGRVLWYQPPKTIDAPLRDQPYPGLVCFVHSDTAVNLAYFDENGVSRSALQVQLVQDDATPDSCGHFAEWMPYQVAQAVK